MPYARLTIKAPAFSLELVPVQEAVINETTGKPRTHSFAPIPNYWALPGGGRATTGELGELCWRRGWIMTDPYFLERRRIRDRIPVDPWTRSPVARLQRQGEALKGGLKEIRP